MRTDEDISSVVYLIDYGKAWYGRDFHDGGEKEKQVDRALSFFSYVCYLRKMKLITEDEFSFFKYDIDRILGNSQMQSYFYNLYHFASKFKTPISFSYLFEYGKEDVFSESFYDSESGGYEHYLNF